MKFAQYDQKKNKTNGMTRKTVRISIIATTANAEMVYRVTRAHHTAPIRTLDTSLAA